MTEGNAVLGWIFFAGACAGVLANVRLTTRRPNPALAIGGTLFFLGPLVIGLRLIAQSLDEMERLAFGISVLGLTIIVIGLALRRSRRA